MKELVDPSLGDNYNTEEMDRVILTASMCIEQSPVLRPRMNQASTWIFFFKLHIHIFSRFMFHLGSKGVMITISVTKILKIELFLFERNDWY